MKKVFALVMIFSICTTVNAGMIDLIITGVGPSADNIRPITPAKEMLVSPSDYIWLDVVYTGDEGLFAADCYFQITGGSASLAFSQITYPTGAWDLTWPGSGGFVDAGGSYVFVSAGLSATGIPAGGAGGTVVSHLLVHREDYIDSIFITPVGTETHGGSLQWDFSTPEFGSGVRLGVPEPISMAMLSVGTILALRRRR